MSRGFDGFEIDDFRGGESRSGPDVDRGSSSSWDSRNTCHNIWREEDQADRLDRESRERSDRGRPPLPREERVQTILSPRVRAKCTDRNKECSLRDSEIHMLGEVGTKGESLSVHGMRTALSKLLQSAVEWNYLTANPARRLVVGDRHPKNERVFLTPTQVRKLISALPEPCRAIVLVLALTGLRIGELLAL